MENNNLENNSNQSSLVSFLESKKVILSEQAKNIINNSTHLKEMGQIIFLDRYSLKQNRGHVEIGDLIIAISKDHPKYPKKDLGIVVEKNEKDLKLKMITGIYAENLLKQLKNETTNEEDEFLEVDLMKCDKPIESIFDTFKRVAKAVASVEENKEEYENKFLTELMSGHIQPAGRIMAGAQVNNQGEYTSNLTLYNCFVIPSPKDSRVSIIKDTLYHLVEIMSRGGGVGINLNTLRPKYTYIKGVNGKSSGSVSWGNLYSNATGLIEQGGSRRGALMLVLSDWHPDIEDFITSKQKIGFLDNANISVLISNAFMDAVKNNKDWNLEFPNLDNQDIKKIYDVEWDGDLTAWKNKGYPTHIYKTIKARDLWKQLITLAWKSAEPGIIFIDRYNDFSNSWYYNKIICTNPCGEQGLPGWGVCNLGHLALHSFLIKKGEDDLGPIYDFNWEALKNSTKTLVRFLDNLIDLTPYVFKEIEDNQKTERRVGLGSLGLAEVLIRLRLKFGDEQSLQFIDKLYKEIAVNSYETSVELAKEKGSFEKLNIEKYMQSKFIQSLPLELQNKIKQNGIRNVTLLTQAPTGTVGSMLGTSTGIEPFYAFKYFQQSRLGFHEVEIELAQDYKKNENSNLPEFFISAMDLKAEDHIRVQAAIQRWTDSSISKTANAPSNFTVEDTMKLYELAFDLNCKGVTIYRDGSRDEQVLSTDAKTGEKNVAEKNISPTKEIEEKPIEEVVYGSQPGNTCPMCKKGTMIKSGGCTECSMGCGFKGSCDMK
ncbi:MAG: adenosylcobalamin-dependent ribonucleoside-diphosphate reductase [Candidatus Woesearchaeota archaeon]